MGTEEAGIFLIFQVKGQRRTDYFSVRLFCMGKRALKIHDSRALKFDKEWEIVIFGKEQKTLDKKTPLYDRHLSLKGKMVSFGGYVMPVQYGKGILAEHMAVRTKMGLFDVSHMGEVLLEGKGALASLNHLMSNDYTNLPIEKVRYSTMLNEKGGVIDDLIVYHLGEDRYMVVVNAATHDKDAAHMKANLLPDTKFTDISDETGLISLQGPLTKTFLPSLVEGGELPEKYYSEKEHVIIGGVDCLVSRTGYTGEFGYEIFCLADKTGLIWDLLLEKGGQDILPCGLGARDTLRLEAAMPLYGHEMDETVSPLETGLDFAVKLNKKEFIGLPSLLSHPPKRERIGLKVTGRGIVREEEDVYLEDRVIGRTTSGTYCPFLKGAYAMALVERGALKPGDTVEADVRGRKVACQVVELPFYKRK